MTRDEIREYVAKIIRSTTTTYEAAGVIAAAWETDVAESVNDACRETEHLYECGCDNPGGLGCDRK